MRSMQALVLESMVVCLNRIWPSLYRRSPSTYFAVVQSCTSSRVRRHSSSGGGGGRWEFGSCRDGICGGQRSRFGFPATPPFILPNSDYRDPPSQIILKASECSPA
mmetsp:Transcript_42758/g.43314  ORF Transcript_42758/g.43314 Transcript_42758/m.43314 type:complete len:106 (-) Transcript_42758:117-434(-)